MAIAFGTLFLVPVSVAKASRFNWFNTEFATMLQNDLQRLGGPRLAGKVQCIDTIDGCFDVLYRMRVEQTDGFVYDEFLFGADRYGVVTASDAGFLSRVRTSPPHLFVVTADLFPSGPGNFRKLEQWPQFASYLAQNYSLCAQRTPPHAVRWWNRTEQAHSYRIYCRNSNSKLPATGP